MLRTLRPSALAAMLGCALCLAPRPVAAQAAPDLRFEPEFEAFATQDKTTPPAPGGILLVGSSTLRIWSDAASDLAPLPVLNRAFGGSKTADLLDRYAQLVPRYRPKVIVYYCGSNDLNAARPDEPALIFSRFLDFEKRVTRDFPDTRLVYLSATRSPDRVPRWEQVDHYNALVRSYCEGTPRRTFIDLNPALVDAQGHPRLDLFQDDKLHLRRAGYQAILPRIQPVLERIWNEVSSTKASPDLPATAPPVKKARSAKPPPTLLEP